MFFAFGRDPKGKPPTTALLLPAATPLSLGDHDVKVRYYSLMFVWTYSILESIVLYPSGAVQFDVDGEENWILRLAEYVSWGSIGKWCVGCALLAMAQDAIDGVVQEKTDLKQLYFGEKWTELSDIITFKIKDIQIACSALFVEFPYH